MLTCRLLFFFHTQFYDSIVIIRKIELNEWKYLCIFFLAFLILRLLEVRWSQACGVPREVLMKQLGLNHVPDMSVEVSVGLKF